MSKAKVKVTVTAHSSWTEDIVIPDDIEDDDIDDWVTKEFSYMDEEFIPWDSLDIRTDIRKISRNNYDD
ncbi:hypothetical protein EKI60_04880 [Candidatus Saccharibacteria bacterium]|nr:MAG: hypothetical protein EKI60_04880 [Candidatus Saccharibacteria bacterium]